MQELYIDERTCQDEVGTMHRFQYFLLADELFCDNIPYTDYGIMVRSNTQQVSIPHITVDRNRITDLLALLCSQAVSPTHLQDVIDDWL